MQTASKTPTTQHRPAFLSKKSLGISIAWYNWQWPLFITALVFSDALMTLVGFRLAYIIRFQWELPIFRLSVVPTPSYYILVELFFLPVLLGLYAARGLYNRHNLLGGTNEYALIFNSTTTGMLLVVVAGFVVENIILARGWLVAAWGLIFFMVALGRFSLRRVVYWLRKYCYFLSPAVIVGANDEGQLLGHQLRQWKSSGFQVIGFLDNKLNAGDSVVDGLPCLGRVDDLEKVLKDYEIEEVILAASAFSSRDHMVDIFRQYGTHRQVKVRFSSGLYEIITTGLTVRDFAYVPLVGVNPVRLTGADQVMKFLLDYSLSIPGLLFSAPILLLIALAIRLDSPGPILHRRRVMGVNGKQFDALKFRTMYVNGDQILARYPHLQAELACNHKLKDDPRVTRIGQVLRKFSLDELPQVINVLRGEMSLVGPRMISPVEIEQYNQWDMNLLTVRPGITGLWQVSGRSDVSYAERVRLDMHYIRNWSIWLDLKLLLQTIPAVLTKRGAY